MPAQTPLQFAIEFSTDSAKSALQGLVGTVKSATIDMAANILGPISPTNLISQIASRGMGIGSAANLLTQGGMASLPQVVQSDTAKLNAQSASTGQADAFLRQMAMMGLRANEGQERSIYDTYFAANKAAEAASMSFHQHVTKSISSQTSNTLFRSGSAMYDKYINQYLPNWMLDTQDWLGDGLKGLFDQGETNRHIRH